MAISEFDVVQHEAGLCVVGGGMAGLCAAVAARRGVKVVLMHDRPVLGGNASSEMRVHVCGADRSGRIPNMRETGILEELRLENVRRNPNRSFSVWDLLLYEKAQFEPNLTLLLNCSCLDAEMDGGRIVSVRGWQLTTQTYHRVRASIFADCSGDAVLAPLTGARFRVGREARSEFGESIAPETADRRTMGMTCLFHAREHDSPQPFESPPWAYRFERCDELPYGAGGHRWWTMGYWWVELGGEQDSIADTERLRDELLRIALGVWDHVKNHCDCAAENWALDWLQFLPAKRESRRYVGAHVLNQNDVEAEGRFEDLVAYGGWSMDDHHPAGFCAVKLGAPATIVHHAPSPFGIPYRSLYSCNVANLMFAGRCASATHAAMSSTRVMGTGCSMGQAVGVAAAMAVARGVDPEAIGGHVDELQQALLLDDCYLPWVPQRFGDLTMRATLTASSGDPAPVRDGTNRAVGADAHAWACRPGDHIGYRFDGPSEVREVTLVVASGLAEYLAMSFHHRTPTLTGLPAEMPKTLRLAGLRAGEWRTIASTESNCRRCVRWAVEGKWEGVRAVVAETWGADESSVYAFYVC